MFRLRSSILDFIWKWAYFFALFIADIMEFFEQQAQIAARAQHILYVSSSEGILDGVMDLIIVLEWTLLTILCTQ